MSMKDGVSKIIRMFGIPRLLLVLVAGAVLVMLSVDDYKNDKTDELTEEESYKEQADIRSIDGTRDIDSYTDRLKREVEEVLSGVSGVGKVNVLITLEGTAEKIVLKDTPSETDKSASTDSSGGMQSKESYKYGQTTILIDNDGNSTPYIIKEKEPVVRGVVVVAQYGDRAEIKKEIIEAIQVLFGIEAHKIKVMKLVN